MQPGTPPAASLLAGLRASLPSPRPPALPELDELSTWVGRDPRLGHHDSELTDEISSARAELLESLTEAMTPTSWAAVPVISLPPQLLCAVRDVDEEDVTPTSEHVSDSYPHVVCALGTFWIADGHRRVIAARRAGASLVQVRLLLSSEELPTTMPTRREIEASASTLFAHR